MENPFRRQALTPEDAADRQARRMAIIWTAVEIGRTGGVSAFFDQGPELAAQGLVMETGLDGKERLYIAPETPAQA